MDEAEISNKLNNAPIESIEANDILDFCAIQRTEGIDLDYKSDWPTDLEKVICSFANTQGGLVLIGVQEEEKTRKPKLPVTGIVGVPAVIYQKIMNIASDGIYPPVSPEVSVCALPNEKDKYVVLIRVLPTRLMHATDRRKRIYVRVADNSRGYDLANMSDMEWLRDRKSKVDALRDDIQKQAILHADSAAVPWKSEAEKDYWKTSPKLQISIIPSIPTENNSIETDRLLKAVQALPQMRSRWTSVDRVVPPWPGHWRSIPGGVCSSDRGYEPDLQYIEFGQHGHIHFTIAVPVRRKTADPSEMAHEIWAWMILSYVDLALRFSALFFEKLEYSWPMTVKVSLEEGSRPLKLNYMQANNGNYLAIGFLTTDPKFSLLDQEVSPFQLTGDNSLLLSAAYNLFWAFGLGWDRNKVSDWIEKLTKK